MLVGVFSFLNFRFNSAKKDNDFIYHEAVPSLETLPSVKGILSWFLSLNVNFKKNLMFKQK